MALYVLQMALYVAQVALYGALMALYEALMALYEALMALWHPGMVSAVYPGTLAWCQRCTLAPWHRRQRCPGIDVSGVLASTFRTAASVHIRLHP